MKSNLLITAAALSFLLALIGTRIHMPMQLNYVALGLLCYMLALLVR